MKSFLRFCMIVAVIALATSIATAQDITGSLTGRVTDNSKAVIPGVTVTLTSTAVQGAREQITDESGTYRFTFLPPGVYSLKYELPGFKTITHDNVTVQVGRTFTLDKVLEVGALSDSVTVVGESPIVDVENATVGTTFNTEAMRDLPQSRDLWTVLAMAPGVRISSQDVGGSHAGTQTGFSSYGTSGQVTVNLDGVITTEGTGSAGFYMDYGAFSEISVSGAGNTAEVATPGTFVNTVIKTGANKLSGEMYADYQGRAFQSKNITQALTDNGIAESSNLFVRYDDFNGDIGGPIAKDKLWWFMSIRDQYSSLAQGLHKDTALPDNSGFDCCIDFYTRLQNQTLKFNYQLTPKNALITTLQGGRKYQPYRGAGTTSPARSTNNQDSWSWVDKYEWTGVLSNRSTLDISVNNFGYWFPQKPHANLSPVTVTGAAALGAASGNLSQRRRWHLNITASLFKDSFLGGSHDLKLGYGYIYEDSRPTTYQTPGDSAHVAADAGTCCVTFSYSAYTFIDYAKTPATVVGTPNRISINDSPTFEQDAMKSHFAFVQDRFQIGRRLTLNLGARFDRYFMFYPDQKLWNHGPPHPGPFWGYAKAGFPEKKAWPGRFDMPSFNDTVPRLSFVYDLFGDTKTALKASWGLFVSNTSTGFAGGANPVGQKTATYAWDGTLPVTMAYLDKISGTSAQLTYPSLVTAAATPIDPDISNARSQEFTFGLDHEIIPNYGIGFTAVRKFSYNGYGTYSLTQTRLTEYMQLKGIDIGQNGILDMTAAQANANGSPIGFKVGDDMIVPVWERMTASRATVDNIMQEKKFKELLYGKPMGNGDGTRSQSYGVLLTKRMSNRWSANWSYDWSKSLGGGGTSEDPNSLYFNTNRPEIGYLYGKTADWDMKAQGIYQLPKILVSGIQLSANLATQSGDNYGRSVSISGSQNAVSGLTADRFNNTFNRDGTCCRPVGTTNTTNHLLQGAVSLGIQSSSQNRLPPTNNLAVRLQKTFKLGEGGKRLDGTFDVFNALNSAAVQGITTSSSISKITTKGATNIGLTLPTYGRFTSILNPRIFRFGGRIRF